MSRSPDYEPGETDTWAAQGFPTMTVADLEFIREEYGLVYPVSGDKTQHFAAGVNRDLEGPDA